VCRAVKGPDDKAHTEIEYMCYLHDQIAVKVTGYKTVSSHDVAALAWTWRDDGCVMFTFCSFRSRHACSRRGALAPRRRPALSAHFR
jgi:hypothetical protein